MSRTLALRSARLDKSVKLLEFIRMYSKDRRRLFCFFEGDDAKYYSIRISIVIPDTAWTAINCCGKSQVLALYDLLSAHPDYSVARAAYFVDRDFDEPLPNGVRIKVYETPCYSIENLFTSKESFERILNGEFGINDGISEGYPLQKCSDLYLRTQKQFHDAIADLNAWIWLQRRMPGIGASKLNLRGVHLEKFVFVAPGEIRKLYSVSGLNKVFPKAVVLDETKISDIAGEFHTEQRRLAFRGKYETEFLRLYLNKLADDFRSEQPCHFPCRGSVRCTFSRDNLISELSQYADTPQCLRDYLSALS